MLKFCKLAIISYVLFFSQMLQASSSHQETLQITQCLAEKIDLSYTTVAENRNYKIIAIASEDIGSLAKQAAKYHCGRFVNLAPKLKKSEKLTQEKALSLLTKPHSATKLRKETFHFSQKKSVEKTLKQINPNNIWDTLTRLTAFHNRSASSQTGVETANWLHEQFKKLAVQYGREDTDSYFVKTGWYYQPSLVTVIGKDIKAPAIVIGAHMDTLDGRMPGAGDDGSGSASILETARAFMSSLSSDFKLKRPVYFIWYAAEERGLVGSQYVVQDFLQQSIPVKAVIQFDMTGFRNDMSDRTMWLFTDYTNKKLTDYLAKLIHSYIKVPVKYSQCGYGCSDHASWTAENIAAAFPCETDYENHNPYIHTSMDTMEHLSLEHMMQFSQLALAFALDMAAE